MDRPRFWEKEISREANLTNSNKNPRERVTHFEKRLSDIILNNSCKKTSEFIEKSTYVTQKAIQELEIRYNFSEKGAGEALDVINGIKYGLEKLNHKALRDAFSAMRIAIKDNRPLQNSFNEIQREINEIQKEIFPEKITSDAAEKIVGNFIKRYHSYEDIEEIYEGLRSSDNADFDSTESFRSLYTKTKKRDQTLNSEEKEQLTTEIANIYANRVTPLVQSDPILRAKLEVFSERVKMEKFTEREKKKQKLEEAVDHEAQGSEDIAQTDSPITNQPHKLDEVMSQIIKAPHLTKLDFTWAMEEAKKGEVQETHDIINRLAESFDAMKGYSDETSNNAEEVFQTFLENQRKVIEKAKTNEELRSILAGMNDRLQDTKSIAITFDRFKKASKTSIYDAHYCLERAINKSVQKINKDNRKKALIMLKDIQDNREQKSFEEYNKVVEYAKDDRVILYALNKIDDGIDVSDVIITFDQFKKTSITSIYDAQYRIKNAMSRVKDKINENNRNEVLKILKDIQDNREQKSFEEYNKVVEYAKDDEVIFDALKKFDCKIDISDLVLNFDQFKRISTKSIYDAYHNIEGVVKNIKEKRNENNRNEAIIILKSINYNREQKSFEEYNKVVEYAKDDRVIFNALKKFKIKDKNDD